MMIIRPIKADDIEVLLKFAQTSSIGITNLPTDRKLLEEKITCSLNSFKKKVSAPLNEYYTFVIEDLENGEIGGTCSIASKTCIHEFKYFYQNYSMEHFDLKLKKKRKMNLLRIVSYRDGPSEICALYLMPHFRKEGFGRLLSLSRFLFVASHPHRFDQTIVAEMRGYIDKKNRCPFWEGLGRHFLDIEFEDLLVLAAENSAFISEILPKYPIYVTLLSQEAQDAIGKTHESTKPAINMLYQEGFQYLQEIDVFDGGPKISIPTSKIRTIQESKFATVKSISNLQNDIPLVLIANDQLDFRACYGKIKILSENEVCIDAHAAKALNIQLNYNVYFSTIYKKMPLQLIGIKNA
jgi:arginine N-succinyltransferase